MKEIRVAWIVVMIFMISNSMAGMDLLKDSFRGLYIKCSIIGLFKWHFQQFLLSHLVSFSFISVLFFMAYFLSFCLTHEAIFSYIRMSEYSLINSLFSEKCCSVKLYLWVPSDQSAGGVYGQVLFCNHIWRMYIWTCFLWFIIPII